MNSLPLISHHLFVAAIGNENRGHERPARREPPYAGLNGGSGAIVVDVPDVRKETPRSVRGVLREGFTEVPA